MVDTTWTPPPGDTPVPEFKPPPGDQEVSPEEVKGMVEANRAQQAIQAAQGMQLQRGAAFESAHPIANAALRLGEASGVTPMLAGIQRAENAIGIPSGNIEQQANQFQPGNANILSKLAGAGGLVAGTYAKFTSVPLAAGMGAAQEFGNGGTPLQSLISGTIDGAIAKVTGGNGGIAGGVIKRALTPILGEVGGRVGAKGLTTGIPLAVGQMLTNMNTGRPLMEGVMQIGALGLAGGAAHGLAPEGAVPVPEQEQPASLPKPPVTAPESTVAPTEPHLGAPQNTIQEQAPIPHDLAPVAETPKQVTPSAPSEQVPTPKPPVAMPESTPQVPSAKMADKVPVQAHPDSFPDSKSVADWYGKTFKDETGGMAIQQMTDQHPGKYIKADVPVERFAPSLTPDTNQGKVAQYAAQGKETAPPVIAVGDKGEQLNIADGGHRVAAAIARGDKTVSAYVPEGSVESTKEEVKPPQNVTPLAEDQKRISANLQVTGQAKGATADFIAQHMADTARKYRESGLADRRQSNPQSLAPTEEQNRRFNDLAKNATFQSPEEAVASEKAPTQAAEPHVKAMEETKATLPKEEAAQIKPTHRVTRLMSQLMKDERGSLDVKRLREVVFNGASKLKDWTGENMAGAGRAFANFAGGRAGRAGPEKAAYDALQKADSLTKQSAFLMDADYKPLLDKTNALIKAGKRGQVLRLADEMESGQIPSDPQFANHAQDWGLDGAAIKKLAIEKSVPGAQFWNENHVGRQYGMLDAKGRQPWEQGYKAPKGSGANGLAPTAHLVIPRSVVGGAESAETAAAAKGMGPMNENPILSAMGKRIDTINYIHHAAMAEQAVKDGIMRKLNVGEQMLPGEKPLQDRLFNPPPRKFTADAAVLKTLNDQETPIKERLATFKQGLKDGSVKELPPASPDELQEHYQNGPGEPGTGEYHPTYPKGRVPEGHGLVDDALAQADRPRYVADGPVADIFNRNLEPAIVDKKNPFYRGMTWINNNVLQAQIGLNAGHYLKLMAGQVGNRLGAFGNALKGGRLGDAIDAARQTIPVSGTAELIKAGREIKSALANPGGKWDQVVNSMVNAGGITDIPDSLRPTQKPLSLNPASWFQFSKRLLFEHYGENLARGLRAMATKEAISEGAKRGYSADHPWVQEQVRQAIQGVNGTFDTMRDDRNFQSRAAGDALKAAFAYPNWTLSKIRNVGQAAIDTPRLFHGEISPAQREVAGNLFAAAILGGASTWASTGKPPQSMEDLFHPYFGSSRVTLPLPYQILTDLIYDRKNPIKFLADRLAPIPSFLVQAYNNRDYSGSKVWNSAKEGHPSKFDSRLLAKSAAREVVPEYLQQGVGLGGKKQQTPEDQTQHFFGLRKYTEAKNAR